MILIVMPHYNELDYIENTLTSLLSQTFNEFEIHIFDDSSNDGSLDIIRRFRSSDYRVHIHENKENKGLINNFIRCYDYVLNSEFDYFLFCQADDYYEPIYLEVMFNNLVSDSTSLLSLVNISEVDKFGQLINYNPNFSRFASKNSMIRMIKYIIEPEALGKCNSFMGLIRVSDFREIYKVKWLENFALDYVISFNLIKKAPPITDSRVLHFKRNDHKVSERYKNYYKNYSIFSFITNSILDISTIRYLYFNYLSSLDGLIQLLFIAPIIIMRGIFVFIISSTYSIYAFIKRNLITRKMS